ncbi:maleylpyruvate isomerase N-terminal domain-containing protein, partial [Streptomyces sp. NPDC005534]|uniref:maleylpyruvate isomerase N-terminal domain-containing protein n=1 Tax=Streptomyces sp. NPDC005534 TaxID=3155714 RepID=UPI003451ED1D
MSDVEGIELLTRAHTRLRDAAAGVPEGAWGAPTPCGEWTVRQVLNHARLDQQAYGAAVTGTGWPDSDAFQPSDEPGPYVLRARPRASPARAAGRRRDLLRLLHAGRV